MKISVMIDSGVPTVLQKPQEPVAPKLQVEEQIRDLIDLCESHRESGVEWKTLKKFYIQLTKMKQNARVTALRDMIRPVLSKYGFHVE